MLIGNAGLSEAVLKEIDSALKAHELIKIKASGAEREDRDAWMVQICNTLSAQPVQHIGKILVVFRPNPEKDEKPAPAKRSTKKAIKKATPGKKTPVRQPPPNKFAPKPAAGRAPRPTTRKAAKPTKPVKKAGPPGRKSSRTPL